MLIYSSPWLIAVSHVLLRLLMPRHSPYALCNLNLLFSYLRWVSQYLFTQFGKTYTNLILINICPLICSFLLLNFIRFSMIICIHSTYSLHLCIASFMFSLAKQSRQDFEWNSTDKACFVEWSVWMDSNHRPRAYQARALTTWATDRGGDDGIRTHDPLLAGQVLSQLSYTPMSVFRWLDQSLKIEQQFAVYPNSYRWVLYYESYEMPLGHLTFSIERRWSSRTFRYGYLVTT